MAEMPYQVYLYVGPAVTASPPGVTVVDITPAESTVDAALEALEQSGLTAADLRTRTLFIAAAEPTLSAVAYAAVCGFAGRRVDYTDTKDLVDAKASHDGYLAAPDTGKPEELPEVVQVGAPSSDPSIPSFEDLSSVSEADVTLIRFARRARLVLGDRPTRQALDLLTALSAVRVRNGSDRFPILVKANDPHVLDPEAIYPGIDLDAARRRGAELRRSRRVDLRDTVVEAIKLTARQVALSRAASSNMEAVLSKLGSTRNEETGFWRCPRPDRHKNGDANPSTRVTDNLVRCFRCDQEPVDALRLVMDVKELGPDDAAAWLVSQAY